MTGRNLDRVIEARTKQKVFSFQEGELLRLAQEEAKARGSREKSGIADPANGLLFHSLSNYHLSEFWSIMTWSPLSIPGTAFCNCTVFLGPCISFTIRLYFDSFRVFLTLNAQQIPKSVTTGVKMSEQLTTLPSHEH